MIKKLPTNILAILRERKHLAIGDTSMDEKFNSMDPMQVVKECATWHLGDSGWANMFYEWFQAVGIIPEESDMR